MDITQYLKKAGVDRAITNEEKLELEKKLFTPEDHEKLMKLLSKPEFYPETDLEQLYRLMSQNNATRLVHACVYDELIQQVPYITKEINGAKKVLDAGCYDGIRLAWYARQHPQTKFIGIDKVVEALQIAQQRITTEELTNVGLAALDIRQATALQDKFNYIIATNVLPELTIQDYLQIPSVPAHDFFGGLQPLSELLTENGKLLFSTHFSCEDCKEVVGQEIKWAIHNANLELEKEHTIEHVHFGERSLNTIWTCTKNKNPEEKD